VSGLRGLRSIETPGRPFWKPLEPFQFEIAGREEQRLPSPAEVGLVQGSKRDASVAAQTGPGTPG
jgi:hypothetical protein